MEEPGQEVIYFSKFFNSRYMEFVVYETHEPLIWTSGEGSTNTNTIIKQGTPKSNTSKISPSSTFDFGYYPHKETCDILSEDLFLCILQACS